MRAFDLGLGTIDAEWRDGVIPHVEIGRSCGAFFFSQPPFAKVPFLARRRRRFFFRGVSPLRNLRVFKVGTAPVGRSNGGSRKAKKNTEKK